MNLKKKNCNLPFFQADSSMRHLSANMRYELQSHQFDCYSFSDRFDKCSEMHTVVQHITMWASINSKKGQLKKAFKNIYFIIDS